MDRAINAWLASSATSEVAYSRSKCPDLQADLKALKKSHQIYGRLLILPAKLDQSPWWQDPKNEADRNDLYKNLCNHLKTTHIAITPPIPPKRLAAQGEASTTALPTQPPYPAEENSVRSPLNFHPLHGDFGPATLTGPKTHPDRTDFALAFWTTTTQNRLHQTWAPRWTMFSRGNIAEKARLLSLSSVSQAVDQGRRGRGTTAVDLYAGIGYFAFSYARAGVRRVLCWDVNGWSLEGLRRGARGNGFGVRDVVGGEEGDGEGVERVLRRAAAVEEDEEGARLLVFWESNERALDRVEAARDVLPPVRHVNCGLLPTSRGSWGTAIRALDPGLGGWVHVHENFAVVEIEERVDWVRGVFQEILKEANGEVGGRRVEVEFVHRVKSYAPGVMHCVVDLHVPGLDTEHAISAAG
ncbi:hypothetical protein MBLNU230_g2963t1 [Neophaeotheca triangularis]